MEYKTLKIFAPALSAALALSLLAGCGAGSAETASVTETAAAVTMTETPAAVQVDESGATAITLSGTSATVSGGASESGGVITISAAGTYVITGTLSEGRVIVDAKGQDVTLVLNGASITGRLRLERPRRDAGRLPSRRSGHGQPRRKKQLPQRVYRAVVRPFHRQLFSCDRQRDILRGGRFLLHQIALQQRRNLRADRFLLRREGVLQRDGEAQRLIGQHAGSRRRHRCAPRRQTGQLLAEKEREQAAHLPAGATAEAAAIPNTANNGFLSDFRRFGPGPDIGHRARKYNHQ